MVGIDWTQWEAPVGKNPVIYRFLYTVGAFYSCPPELGQGMSCLSHEPVNLFVFNIVNHALPALPTWIMSLVCSSLLSVGQLDPSNFTRVSSSFVPIILYFD